MPRPLGLPAAGLHPLDPSMSKPYTDGEIGSFNGRITGIDGVLWSLCVNVPPPLKTTVFAESFPPRASWSGIELLGRYLVGDRVGSGGFGVVYRAEDSVEGRSVAVKAHSSTQATALKRLGREIATLRQLKLPGVVRFLDSGVFEDTPFIVMEFVDGSPFPGAGVPEGSWESLEPVVVALLEALSRLHRRSFVHRDLKPSNVLVDERGVPTILDFGLAWAPELGERLTGPGIGVGTPAYLAPEQLGGNVVDRRSDLFSLGVMIYEALSGNLPFHGLDMHELAYKKAHTVPEPLHRIDEKIPRRVSDLVQRLLAANPRSRPEDAADVIAVIRGEHSSRDVLPWIDSSGLAARIESALTKGVSFDITGGPGSGKSRSLEECARVATARGIEVRYTVETDSAFASLETVLTESTPGEKQAGGTLSIDEKVKQIRTQLERFLVQGAVLLVDDSHRIDPLSARAIEGARGSGVVVRITPDKDAMSHSLESFSAEDLRALFRGRDRIFHIREDAAEQLYLRTDGIPDLVNEELAAWGRAGVCGRSDGLWSITRAEIDQLAAGFGSASSLRVSKLRERLTHEEENLIAWIDFAFPNARSEVLAACTKQELWRVEAQLADLREKNLVRVSAEGSYGALVTGLATQIWDDNQMREAHRLLVDHIPHGSANRLFHLFEAQSDDLTLVDTAADEVVACGMRLKDEECFGEAVAALANGLKFVRSLGRPEKALEILEVWALAALAANDVRQLESLARELCELPSEFANCALLKEHVELWITSMRSGGEVVITQLKALPTYPNELIERQRGVAMIFASSALSRDREREIVDSLLELNAESSRSWLKSMLPRWQGRVSYREGDYAKSAAQYRTAAMTQNFKSAQAIAWINVAYACLELSDWGEGRLAIENALDCLAEMRSPTLELRCHDLLRKIEYRQARDVSLDPELVEIAREAEAPVILASLLLSEAAIAWRSGDVQLAGRLASESSQVWNRIGRDEPSALAGAFTQYCCADVTLDPAVWIETAVRTSAPGISAQILALLSKSGVEVPLEELKARCELFPKHVWEHRREILSIAECARA